MTEIMDDCRDRASQQGRCLIVWIGDLVALKYVPMTIGG